MVFIIFCPQDFSKRAGNGNMIRQLLNIFHFNKIFWWVIGILLVSNIVFFAAIRERQRDRINELQGLYNSKRGMPTQKKNNDQAPFLQARDDIRLFKEKLSEKKDFTETADYDGLYKYSTSLTVNGSYQSIKALLAEIQESRTLFCIEALSIAGNPGEGTVEMKIKIATYFR